MQRGRMHLRYDKNAGVDTVKIIYTVKYLLYTTPEPIIYSDEPD